MNTEKLSRSLLEELETLQHVLDDVAGENVDLSETLSGLDNIDDIPVLHELLSKSEDPALRGLDTSASADKSRASELKAVEPTPLAEPTREPLRPRTTRDVLNALHKHIEAHYGNTDLLDSLASKLEAHESSREALESKTLSDSLAYGQKDYQPNDDYPPTPTSEPQETVVIDLGDTEQKLDTECHPDNAPDSYQPTFDHSILDNLMEPGADREPNLDLNAFDTFNGSPEQVDDSINGLLTESISAAVAPLPNEAKNPAPASNDGDQTSTADGLSSALGRSSPEANYAVSEARSNPKEPETEPASTSLGIVRPPSRVTHTSVEAVQTSLPDPEPITQTSHGKASTNPFLPQSVLDKLSREREAAQQSAEEAHKTMQRVAEQKETRLQDQLQQLNQGQKQAMVDSLVEELMPQVKARLREKLGQMLDIHSDKDQLDNE